MPFLGLLNTLKLSWSNKILQYVEQETGQTTKHSLQVPATIDPNLLHAIKYVNLEFMCMSFHTAELEKYHSVIIFLNYKSERS